MGSQVDITYINTHINTHRHIYTDIHTLASIHAHPYMHTYLRYLLKQFHDHSVCCFPKRGKLPDATSFFKVRENLGEFVPILVTFNILRVERKITG